MKEGRKMSEDNKQENSTYAVKLEGDTKKELLVLLEGYKEATGANAGDFIKTLMEVYKTNKIVSKVSSTDADIKELNTLTNRIYGIYSNLIERNSNNNNALQEEFSLNLTQKDIVINNLKGKIQIVESDKDTLTEQFNIICRDKEELEQNNKQLQKLNDSLEFNNSKLKEDTISLQNFKSENNRLLNEIETIKGLLASQKADNIKLQDTIKANVLTIDNLNTEIESKNIKHSEELKTVKEKAITDLNTAMETADLNKNKEILSLKEQYQERIEKKQDEYNNKISQYQDKHEELLKKLEELDQLKAKRATNKDKQTEVK